MGKVPEERVVLSPAVYDNDGLQPETTMNIKRLFTITSTILLSSFFVACSSSIPRKEPASVRFPEVHAESLAGEKVSLPADLAGAPAILLVGYAQNAQFDIDRWILGLKQLGSKTKILELPTIKGMLPGMASTFINQGMKRGIPSEDWSSVVTV